MSSLVSLEKRVMQLTKVRELFIFDQGLANYDPNLAISAYNLFVSGFRAKSGFQPFFMVEENKKEEAHFVTHKNYMKFKPGLHE